MHSPELCNSVLNSCSWGFHVGSWETWQSWTLQEFPALQWAHWHPWGSQTPGSPLKKLSLISEPSSFDCLTTFITKPRCVISQPAISWLFPQGLWLSGWDTTAMCLGWQSSMGTHSDSHSFTLACSRACTIPGLSVGQPWCPSYSWVFSLMLPYLMKPTSWCVYLLNNMFHHNCLLLSSLPKFILCS